jgi:arylsulfatase A
MIQSIKNSLKFYSAAGLGCLSSFIGATKAEAEKNQKTNFIIILADDLGYGDIGCFGNTNIKTPNIDRMASQGMLMTDFHTNGAVSTPTRTALLTGRYQQRAGMEGVLLTWVEKHELAGLQPEEVTFADVLKKNGYRTAIFGKWHVGTLNKYNPVNHGFDEFVGFKSGNVDYRNFYDTSGRNDWWCGDSLKHEEGYLTELITKKSLDFIEQNKQKPFCLYVAHGCPHYPYQGPDDPPFRKLGVPGMHQSPREDKQTAYKEMIEYMDKGVGQILEKLKKEGLDKNTFVVFMSDNGPTGPGSSGELRGKKGDLFEGGHRVPGIFWMPSLIKPGQVCNQPAIGMDLFPTMLALAQIKYKNKVKPLDGVDLTPLMTGNIAAKRTIFWRNDKGKAVRDGDFKCLIAQTGKGKNKSNTTYLFDLKNDFKEQNNLIEKYPELVKQLLAKLKDWEKSVDSEVPEQIQGGNGKE